MQNLKTKKVEKLSREVVDTIQCDFGVNLQRAVCQRIGGMRTSVSSIGVMGDVDGRSFMISLYQDDYDYMTINLKWKLTDTIERFTDLVEYYFNEEDDKFEVHKADAIERFVIDLLNKYDCENVFVNVHGDIVDVNLANQEDWCYLDSITNIQYDNQEEILCLEDEWGMYTIYLTEDRMTWESTEVEETCTCNDCLCDGDESDCRNCNTSKDQEFTHVCKKCGSKYITNSKETEEICNKCTKIICSHKNIKIDFNDFYKKLEELNNRVDRIVYYVNDGSLRERNFNLEPKYSIAHMCHIDEIIGYEVQEDGSLRVDFYDTDKELDFKDERYWTNSWFLCQDGCCM